MMAGTTIRELVDRIVTCDGRKGQATQGLENLHAQLEKDIAAATDPAAAQAMKQDKWFLEGYMETPAAALADCESACRMIDRKPRRRR